MRAFGGVCLFVGDAGTATERRAEDRQSLQEPGRPGQGGHYRPRHGRTHRDQAHPLKAVRRGQGKAVDQQKGLHLLFLRVR